MHDTLLHEGEPPLLPAYQGECRRGGDRCHGWATWVGCLNCGWPGFLWYPLPDDEDELKEAVMRRQLRLAGT